MIFCLRTVTALRVSISSCAKDYTCFLKLNQTTGEQPNLQAKSKCQLFSIYHRVPQNSVVAAAAAAAAALYLIRKHSYYNKT